MTDDQRDEVTCEDCARNLYEFLDGELEPRLYEQIRRHLEICRRCYPVFNFERAFLDYLNDRGVKPQHSHELESRLNALLKEIDAEEG